MWQKLVCVQVEQQQACLDGDYYTDAQCEAMVMCGNNHWIITPNLTRSIQIDSWPGGPKS